MNLYNFIVNPVNNNYVKTISDNGKQIILHYLYQLGGNTGMFDILADDIQNNKITDEQRKKRNQKKKNQKKRKIEKDKQLKIKSKLLMEQIKKELDRKEEINKEIYYVVIDKCNETGYNFTETEAKESVNKVLELFRVGQSEIFEIATNIYEIRMKIEENESLSDEETLRLESDIERMVYKLSNNFIVQKAVDILISSHIQGEDSETYFKDSSLLKKFIDYFTPDPLLLQHILSTQGTGFIINIPKRLQELNELMEIAEKNNNFNKINKYIDEIKSIQELKKKLTSFTKKEKQEDNKSLAYLWPKVQREIQKRQNEIAEIESSISEAESGEFTDEEFIQAIGVSKDDLTDISNQSLKNKYISGLQQLIEKKKISIEVMKQVKVEIDPRTGFPIGENAGFLDYLVWILQTQDKFKKIADNVKIPPKYMNELKGWLTSFVYEEEGVIQISRDVIIDELNKHLEEDKKIDSDVSDKKLQKALVKVISVYHPDKQTSDEKMYSKINLAKELLFPTGSDSTPEQLDSNLKAFLDEYNESPVFSTKYDEISRTKEVIDDIFGAIIPATTEENWDILVEFQGKDGQLPDKDDLEINKEVMGDTFGYKQGLEKSVPFRKAQKKPLPDVNPQSSSFTSSTEPMDSGKFNTTENELDRISDKAIAIINEDDTINRINNKLGRIAIEEQVSAATILPENI